MERYFWALQGKALSGIRGRILSILLFMAVNVQMFAEVPKVSNVRASQRDGTKIVDIKYDVEDAENDKLVIRVQIICY